MSLWDYTAVVIIFLIVYYNERLWHLVIYSFDKLTTIIEEGEIK